MPNARAVIVCASMLLASIGCGGSNAKPSDVVFTSGGVDAYDGKRVSVRGIYSLIDARKHAPDEKPVFDGHAVIILEDGTRVTLEPIDSPKAIRPDEEIHSYAGRMVVVTGVLTKLPPPQPDHPQDVMMPCLANIEEVRVVSP